MECGALYGARDRVFTPWILELPCTVPAGAYGTEPMTTAALRLAVKLAPLAQAEAERFTLREALEDCGRGYYLAYGTRRTGIDIVSVGNPQWEWLSLSGPLFFPGGATKGGTGSGSRLSGGRPTGSPRCLV